MPFVLDNSLAMSWCFRDEATAYADRVLDQLETDVALVPAIWPLEVSNAVLTGARRQRLQMAETVRFLALLRSLPITVDASSLDRAVGPILDLARSYALSAYDASYLELAMREGIALATQDARLSAAAHAAGITLVT